MTVALHPLDIRPVVGVLTDAEFALRD